MSRKLTLIWQIPDSHHKEWIREIFSPIIEDEVVDGRHEVVLDNCLLADTHLHLRDASYYEKFRGLNAFLLREPDEHFRDVDSVYPDFCGVFRMHYSGVFRPERVMHVPLGYGLGLSRKDTPKLASQRRYVWAMLGQINKATRPDAVNALLSIEPNFWHASDGWTPGVATAATISSSAEKPKENYRQLLAESMFSPAPMGNVQQETNRPFEALEAGSIPLLERRLLMDSHRKLLGNHPLPTFSNWKAAAEFVRSMLADSKGLDQLQAECVTWWDHWKRDFGTDAEDFITRLWRKPATDNSEFVRWYGHLPGWMFWELLRHHSPAALRRRVLMQTRRIMRRVTV